MLKLLRIEGVDKMNTIFVEVALIAEDIYVLCTRHMLGVLVFFFNKSSIIQSTPLVPKKYNSLFWKMLNHLNFDKFFI